MKKKQFLVNDTVIVVNYEEADFTEALKGYADCDTTYLVRYDSGNNCAIVDQSAPEWYKGLAALHEMICCGHFFEDLVPNINKADQDHRCMCIEKFIIDSVADEWAYPYAISRENMFKILLSNNLCTAEFRTSISKTLEYLDMYLR